MNEDALHIFEETGCLSEQQLLDYLNGKLSDEEMHLTEAHITGCEFCSDALEGLAEVKNKGQIPLIVRQLHQQLRHELQSHQSKARKVKMYTWLSALVFVILLILLIAFMAIHFSLKKDKQTHPPATPVPTVQKE